MRRYFFFILIVFLSALSVHGNGLVLKLPRSATVTEPNYSGKTWTQNGLMPLTYVASLNQMSTALRDDGWRRVQFIELDKKKSRCLMVWMRGARKITVMMWRETVNQTGFSWGIHHDK